MSSKADKSFDELVARKNELQTKQRRTQEERAELEALNNTFEVFPDAASYEEHLRDMAQSREDVASGRTLSLDELEASLRQDARFSIANLTFSW